MSLFEDISENPLNILPHDGTVHYYGKVFSKEKSEQYYHYLFNQIPWENDEAVIFGKLILTKRKVAWFGEKAFEYTYSKRTKYAKFWTPELLELKQKCEEVTGETYNSCLLNLYHDGSEGMAYHSDGETDLKKHGAIASLTFGAERKFLFKHKTTKEKIEILLENGSLLVMKGTTQDHWLHRLPPTTKIKTPRVNLTFRTIENKEKGD
ncbi:alpha-ketoglutarate-dependent dioxygenase AlkB family protein [Chryseobacterium flavum]|uniref:alpha-ketoglutarate-dependent dioxygenase AlkB family protein n=1 Tax=Chryseobacterium flavum TaxID=415851 RepID=UPI0028AB7B27|nr:alpha-ketoglutarate-dependent dioxygenase AlkB [Chryseobacterium flavum]